MRIKQALAIAFCIMLLCNVAFAAESKDKLKISNTATSSNTKGIVSLGDAKSGGSNSTGANSTGTVISLAESAGRSQNTSIAISQNNSSNSESTGSKSTGSEGADNGNFLSNAVSSGIMMFLRAIFDGMYNDIYADGHGPGESSTGAVNGTEYTNSSNTLYDALTSVPHPYENQTIVKMYGGYLNLTLFCITIFVLGALISRSIARARLDKHVSMTQAVFVGGIAICLLALIANIIYMFALDIVEALNQYIMLPAMPAMTPDPTDDLFISIIQSICDFLLLGFFNVRYYMLNVVAVGCSIVVVLLVPELSRDFAENCLEKIIRILFLQPAALFVYVVCTLSAPGLPGGFNAVSHISTTVLVFATCWYFMFGNFTLLKKGVSFVIRKGVKKV